MQRITSKAVSDFTAAASSALTLFLASQAQAEPNKSSLDIAIATALPNDASRDNQNLAALSSPAPANETQVYSGANLWSSRGVHHINCEIGSTGEVGFLPPTKTTSMAALDSEALNLSCGLDTLGLEAGYAHVDTLIDLKDQLHLQSAVEAEIPSEASFSIPAAGLNLIRSGQAAASTLLAYTPQIQGELSHIGPDLNYTLTPALPSTVNQNLSLLQNGITGLEAVKNPLILAAGTQQLLASTNSFTSTVGTGVLQNAASLRATIALDQTTNVTLSNSVMGASSQLSFFYKALGSVPGSVTIQTSVATILPILNGASAASANIDTVLNNGATSITTWQNGVLADLAKIKTTSAFIASQTNPLAVKAALPSLASEFNKLQFDLNTPITIGGINRTTLDFLSSSAANAQILSTTLSQYSSGRIPINTSYLFAEAMPLENPIFKVSIKGDQSSAGAYWAFPHILGNPRLAAGVSLGKYQLYASGIAPKEVDSQVVLFPGTASVGVPHIQGVLETLTQTYSEEGCYLGQNFDVLNALKTALHFKGPKWTDNLGFTFGAREEVSKWQATGQVVNLLPKSIFVLKAGLTVGAFYRLNFN